MISKKVILFAGFIIALLIPALSLRAYDAPRIYVKEINLSETSFKGGDTIKGDFLMWNTTDGIVADLDYKISLKKDYQVFGEKIFLVADQLNPDGTGKQNFSYAIPANIASGNYTLFIRLYTKTGMPLNWGQKDIVIKGNDVFLQISDSKLMQGDREFEPALGVNFDPNENTPAAVISARNSSAKNIEFDLKITVYSVQSNMEELESFSGEKGIFDSGETRSFSIALPKYETAGTYLAKAAFYENNIIVSNEESFRWVIKGDSARILKIESKEDFFQKDKNTEIIVDLIGPADNSSVEGAILTVSIFDQEGKNIASSAKEVRLSNGVNSEIFNLVLKTDVANPRIEAKITKDGKELDGYVYKDGKVNNIENSAKQALPPENSSKLFAVFALLFLFIGLIASFVIIIIKYFKNKKILPFILLTISLAAGSAVLYTAKINNIFTDAAGLDDLSITWNEPVDNSVFDFGEAINFNGDVNVTACVNGVAYMDAQAEICDKDQANCVVQGNFLSVIPKAIVRINETGTDYVFVLDAGGRVIKYKESDFGTGGTISTPVAVFGEYGSGIGQFKSPDSMNYDSVGGYIYVADTDNNRIVRFKPGDANSPINNWKANWQVIGADRVTKLLFNWIESPAGSGTWIEQNGSYYSPTMPPIITFSGGGGSGAAATAVVNASGKVTAINITNVGSGYSSAPTVSIQKPGIRAIATTTPASGGSGCTAATVVISGGGGTGATATATTTVSGALTFTITERGRNYTAGPITITPLYTCTTNPTISGVYTITTGTTASAYSTLGVTSPLSVFYDSAGSYLYVAERGTNNRVVRFKPSDISNTWQAFGSGWGVSKGYFRSVGAVFYDSSSELSGPGSGYIYVAGGWSSQIIRFKAANMMGTWQKVGADSLTGIKVENGGLGYTSVPSVTISGGGAVVNATATAVLGIGADSDKVVSITVDTGGMGYTSEPAVTISGGGGAGATATTWFGESFAGSGVGQFGNPKGVYYDSGTDFVYVSGGGNVVRFKAGTNMISGSRAVADPVTDWTDFGGYGSGVGNFNLVRGSFYDPISKNIYTADEANYRIVKIKEAEDYATATAVIDVGGVVTDTNISDKGKGYTSVPIVTISGGGGSGATAVVNSIVDNKVQSIIITAGGSGYTSAPTITISKIGSWSEIDFTDSITGPDFFPYRMNTTIPASFAAPFTLGVNGEAWAKVKIKARDNGGNYYETISYAPIKIKTNNAPTAIVGLVTQPNYCNLSASTVSFSPIFNWAFSDVDGNTQGAYQVQVATDNLFTPLSIVHDSLRKDFELSRAYAPSIPLTYNKTYYWQVRVWDDLNKPSVFAGSSFDTPIHAYPAVNFTPPDPANFIVNSPVKFTNNSVCYDNLNNPVACDPAGYLWDFCGPATNPPELINQGNCTVASGKKTSTLLNPSHVYDIEGRYDVILRAIDSTLSVSCSNDSGSKVLGATRPKWKEVVPR